MEQYTNLRVGERGAYLSIIAYIFLSVLKLTVGYMGDSEALKADGLNNTTDIIASIAVLIGLRISQRPPDNEHRYGHFRAETLASLIAAFIMVYVGIQVLLTAIKNMITPINQEPSVQTIVVSIFSAIVMYGVYKYNNHLANKINSMAVKAAAYDNRSDALVSIGTAVGITAAILGFAIIDTITAFIIGLIIIKTAFEILKEAMFSLTDGFDTELIEIIEEKIAQIPRVRKVEDVRGRSHGSAILGDITVSVNPNLNVRESHVITEQIEQVLRQLNPYATALIHIEPYEPKEIVICEDDYHF